MKTANLSIAALLSCALFLVCACGRPIPPWEPTALGEISADRCVFYCEGEDFGKKSGGDIDFKRRIATQLHMPKQT